MIKGKAGSTVVLPCHCTHAYQDRVHGIGMRVFNLRPAPKPELPNPARCTVCGAVR